MESGSEYPTVVLIVCEGEKTEPQYFDIVTKHRRVHTLTKIEIFGNKGQHKRLIDEAVVTQQQLSKTLGIELDEIEVWAVCDKDEMAISIDELIEYAASHNVQLAFSDPKFEVFFLQHFKRSATNHVGKQLDNLVHKELQKKGVKSGYSKKDLSPLISLLDNEPSLLETAIANCSHIDNKSNTPFTTTHKLLSRLLDIAP